MAEIFPVSDELSEELQELRVCAENALQISQSDNPVGIVSTINDWIRTTRSSSTVVDDDVVLGVAALLGDQYVRAFGWRWGEVKWDHASAETTTCVLSPDDGLAINAFWWVYQATQGLEPGNVLLNFNMIAAGNAPASMPGEAVGFH